MSEKECSVCGGTFEYTETVIKYKGDCYCESCYEDEKVNPTVK